MGKAQNIPPETKHRNNVWTKRRNSVRNAPKYRRGKTPKLLKVTQAKCPYKCFPMVAILPVPFFTPPFLPFFYFHHKAAHLKGQPHCTHLIIKWPFRQLPVPSLSTHIRVPLRSPSRGQLVGPSSAPATCVSSSSPAAMHQRTHLPPCLPAPIRCTSVPLEIWTYPQWQYTSVIKTKWWHPNLWACMPF